LADLATKSALDRATLRRLLEQEIVNTESRRASGEENWEGRLSLVVRVARSILAPSECTRLAERLLQGTSEGYVRRDRVLRDACILVAMEDPLRALEMAEPLVTDFYVSPLSEMARIAPQAIFDYILARERSRQGEKIFFSSGHPQFYPFQHALEALKLSAKELRELRVQVEMISNVDSPKRVIEGLLVTRLLEEGEVERAIKYVELECPQAASVLVPTLAAEARWDDIKRILIAVKDSDASLHDDLLGTVIEDTLLAQPERALDYAGLIEDPRDKLKALRCILSNAVQNGMPATKAKDIFEQMLELAHLVDIKEGSQRTLRETLSFGLEILSPLESAAAMVKHKNHVPPTNEEIVCWAEHAFSEAAPDQYIVQFRKASNLVARQLGL